MVSIRSLISSSSSPLSKTLVTVLCVLITISIIVTHIYCFLCSLAKFKCLSLYHPLGRQSPLYSKFSFFCQLLLGLVFWSGLGDLFVSQNHKEFYVSLSRMNSDLYMCHLVVWSNVNFLHNSQWITFPTSLCLVLYSFCASFQFD